MTPTFTHYIITQVTITFTQTSINLDLNSPYNATTHISSSFIKTIYQTMAHAKLPLFVFLILFVLSSSSGKLIVKELTHVDAQPPVAEIPSFLPTEVKNIHGKMADRLHFPHKIKVPSMKARKLLEEELVQPDYDYAGPNPKHDPKKGRGGGRSL